MGLDIVIYKKDQERKIIDIKEGLHKIILSNRFELSGLAQLLRLKDYYKTNVNLNVEEVLITELKLISEQLIDSLKDEINEIIYELSIPDVQKVHIAGD